MRTWKIILIIVSTAMLIAPLTAYATTSMFADVPNDHIFVEDINWMKTAGITNGCGDGTNYCPNDNVTRGQMAAFMHRLAVNRVVNADKLDGRDSSDFVVNAEWVTKSTTFSSLAAGSPVFAEAKCPKLKHVVSGGGLSVEGRLVMIASHPSSGDTAWTATWTNLGPNPLTSAVTSWALCEGPELLSFP